MISSALQRLESGGNYPPVSAMHIAALGPKHFEYARLEPFAGNQIIEFTIPPHTPFFRVLGSGES